MNILKRIIFFVTLTFVSSNLYCQLILSTASTPAQLVQNTLVGNGITTSNISYAGGSASRASFTNGSTTNLGLNNGIVLSTCPASLILNPASYLMSNNLGLAGDADLDAINNGCQTYDACVLEFDFVPMSDTVKFRYVFGSEEYPNYVCSQYNDVFAFFVTGPNPTGGNYNDFNIARIPGTSLPVSVNSVNSGTPGGSYNSSGCTSLSYANYYVDNAALGSTNIAFNGFTTPLTAWCKVVPCQTYHIKIAVADGYNGLYDSSVFLEANSFVSNTFQVQTSYSDTSSNSASESCSQGIFSFILSSPATSPFTINYTVSGSATNGTDYTTIPNSITIAPGQDSAAIVINPIFDGISEGTETVVITYTNGCTPQTKTINISDYTILQVTTNNDTAVCSGETATLLATVTGGNAPFLYTWSNGTSGNNTLNVAPTTTTSYTVTVTDDCSNTATSGVLVIVDTISVTTTVTDEMCGQSNGSVTATPSTTCPSGQTYLWNTTPYATTSTVNNLSAGVYEVTVSCGACSMTASATVNNTPGPSISVVSVTNTHCGQADGSVTISATGGTGPYVYQWNSTPTQTTENLQNVSQGNYTVTVTDAIGCTETQSFNVIEFQNPEASFTANPSVTVIDNVISFFNFSSNSSQYLWNFDDGASSTELNPEHSYPLAGIYQVWLYVQNNFNCKDSISHEIIVNEDVTFYMPNAFTPDNDGINDFFGPKGVGLINDNFEMYIYNRWGELVFKTTDFNNLWDGTAIGTRNLCPQDVYTWVVLFKKQGRTDHITRYTGVITLF